jgi:hypothetical protein
MTMPHLGMVLVSLDMCNVGPDGEFIKGSANSLKDVKVGTDEVKGEHLVMNGAVDIVYQHTFFIVDGD